MEYPKKISRVEENSVRTKERLLPIIAKERLFFLIQIYL